MSRLVRTHAAFLRLLYETNAKQRKMLLQTITSAQLQAVLEVTWNVYRGTFPVSDYYVKKMAPYKTSIRTLVSKRVSNKRKKEILLHRRKILPWVIKPVLSLLNEDSVTETD